MSDVVVLLKTKNQYGVLLCTLCNRGDNKVSLIITDQTPLLKLFEKDLFCFQLSRSEVIMKCAIAGYPVYKYETVYDNVPSCLLDVPKDVLERLA